MPKHRNIILQILYFKARLPGKASLLIHDFIVLHAFSAHVILFICSPHSMQVISTVISVWQMKVGLGEIPWLGQFIPINWDRTRKQAKKFLEHILLCKLLDSVELIHRIHRLQITDLLVQILTKWNLNSLIKSLDTPESWVLGPFWLELDVGWRGCGQKTETWTSLWGHKQRRP